MIISCLFYKVDNRCYGRINGKEYNYDE